MKNWLNNYRSIFIGIGLSVFLVSMLFILLKSIDAIDVNSDNTTNMLAFVGGVITLTFTYTSISLSKDQFFVTLFKDFNMRFDEINEDLNAIRDKTFNDTGTRTKASVMEDYLNLCAEEYFWFKKNRIPQNVWSSWFDGINYYLRKEMEDTEIKKYFDTQKPYSSSYYNFFDCLGK